MPSITPFMIVNHGEFLNSNYHCIYTETENRNGEQKMLSIAPFTMVNGGFSLLMLKPAKLRQTIVL